MADQFAARAGFAGDETTEASMMPPPRRQQGAADSTFDSDSNGYTGIVQPHQPMLPSLREESPSIENRPGSSSSGTIGRNGKPATTTAKPSNMGSIRIPATRVPLQPSTAQSGSGSNSRPSSAQAARRPSPALDLDEDEEDAAGDSSDEALYRPNQTLANETTLASVDGDASEWARHIRDSKTKAGVGMKAMQNRIDHLLQERDDLKIEVDMLRRQYNPDERASELIRLRQENIRITNHRITLSDLLTGQKKVMKDLQRQVKMMGSDRGGGASRQDSDMARRLEEMEEAVKTLDQQREEEREARLAAEEEAENRRVELADLERARNELQVSSDRPGERAP